MTPENKPSQTTTEAPQTGANKTVADLARQFAAAKPASSEVAPAAPEQREEETEESQPEVESPEAGNPTESGESEQDQQTVDEGDDQEAVETQEEEPEKASDEDDLKSFLQGLKLEPDRSKAIGKMANRLQKTLRKAEESAKQLEAANARIAQLETQAPQVDVSKVLKGQNPKLQAVEEEVNLLNTAITNAREAIEEGGTTVMVNGKEVQLTPKQLAGMIDEWETLRQDAVTRRRLVTNEVEAQTNQIRSQAQQIARTHYSWIDKPQDPTFLKAQAELNELGELGKVMRSLPQFSVMMGRYMAGLAQEEAAASKGAKPASQRLTKPANGREPAKIVTGSPAVKPAVDDLQAKLKAAKDDYRATGTSAAKQKVLALEQLVAARATTKA